MKKNRHSGSTALVLSLVFMSGCLSSKKELQVEEVNAAGAFPGDRVEVENLFDPLSKPKPVVEAYVEFTGTHPKWAGPTTWVLHVSTREATRLVVNVSPKSPFKTAERTLASASSPATSENGIPGKTLPLKTIKEARNQLWKLAKAMREDSAAKSASSAGCMSPIRVRLIQVDGSAFERKGCRSQTGWTQVASQVTAYFM